MSVIFFETFEKILKVRNNVPQNDFFDFLKTSFDIKQFSSTAIFTFYKLQ